MNDTSAETPTSVDASATSGHLNYVRLFATPDGETHFEELIAELTLRAANDTAPPLLVSDWQSAERMNFASFPVGWHGEDVRAPQKTLVVWIAGTCAVQTGDGVIRYFQSGDVLLVDDSIGKGHRPWNAGNDPVLAVAIQLLH